MTVAWSADDLARIGSAVDPQITTERADGTLRRWVPIWVVCVDQQVYVRTWYRRGNGWFGQVLRWRGSASRGSRSMSPLRMSARVAPNFARTSALPTMRSTDANAARLSIAWPPMPLRPPPSGSFGIGKDPSANRVERPARFWSRFHRSIERAAQMIGGSNRSRSECPRPMLHRRQLTGPAHHADDVETERWKTPDR